MLALTLALWVGGCGSTPLYQPVPQALVTSAVLPPHGRIRYFGDRAPEDVEALLEAQLDQLGLLMLADVIPAKPHPATAPTAGSTVGPTAGGSARPRNDTIALHFVALSGGGSDGSFGAGLMLGWSESGTRPTFHIVSAISAGALIAPFAFLGADWDPQLRAAFQALSPRRIYEPTVVEGLTGGAALLSSRPLSQLIADVITPDVLDAIALAHRQGRRLFIRTTYLDVQRPVMWDIGALANSPDPEAARALIHQIILASASVPGAFPAVLIDVEAGGQPFQELHVDGGVTSQVALLPREVPLERLRRTTGRPVEMHLWVVRNGKLLPAYLPDEASLFSVVRRSLSTLIKSHGLADIRELYLFAQLHDVRFHLAAIPESFRQIEREPFEAAYMQALFQVGLELGRRGMAAWADAPPDPSADAFPSFSAVVLAPRPPPVAWPPPPNDR